MEIKAWPIGCDATTHPLVLVSTESGSTYLIDAEALTATRMLPLEWEIDVIGIPEGVTDEGRAVHVGRMAAVRTHLPDAGRLLAGLRNDGEPLSLAALPAANVGSPMVLAILGLVDADHVTIRTTTPVVEIRVGLSRRTSTG